MVPSRAKLSFILQVDIDGSGEIDFEEFCDLMMKMMWNANPENEVGRIIILRFKRNAWVFDP